MIEWVKSKLNLKADSYSDSEYENSVQDLIQHEMVVSMKNFIQHSDVSCLEHSLCVSYCSYLICRRLRLDYCSAARGGLLHDFFLYDWHVSKPDYGMHGFVHPCIALKNANDYFNLNEVERDIILKHMWPLTIRVPKYKETFVVLLVDKYCTVKETINFGNRKHIYKLKNMFGF